MSKCHIEAQKGLKKRLKRGSKRGSVCQLARFNMENGLWFYIVVVNFAEFMY